MTSSPSSASTADAAVERIVSSRQLNARSLILSIFGDSICTHGGSIWLGSLIRLVKPLGINQRLVRTSVFRLSEKQILQSKQLGRRSFYSLTDRGFRQFSSAAERIYHHQNLKWDGEWRMVFTNLNGIDPAKREAFQKELHWLGFSRLAKGVYGHPVVDENAVRLLASEMQIENSIVIMKAKNQDDNTLNASAQLVRHCFGFDRAEQEYRFFLDLFEPLVNIKFATEQSDDEACFLLRTLLIDYYRHILLHEPDLPRSLIPQASLSLQVKHLVQQLYADLSASAERHFLNIAESESGKLPTANEEYHQRFQAD